VFATVEHPEEVRTVAWDGHGQQEAWYRFPDLEVPASQVVHRYGRRFPIEEVFRDQKRTRWGWSLREYRLQDRADRLDRLLLVVACADFMVSVIGYYIEQKGLDRWYKANTDQTKTHSALPLGWKGHSLVRWLALSWLRAFRNLVFDLQISSCLAHGGAPCGPTVHTGMGPWRPAKPPARPSKKQNEI